MSHYTLKDFRQQMSEGLFDKNPVLVQMLGMCSTLAVSTSITNALGMGLAVTAVLICSNIFISLLRKFIPKQIRIASYIVIISGFVTAIQLLISAFLPALDKSLGLFIPLIVVNCIILARAESFASKNPVLPSAVDGLAMGVGFTFALSCLAAIRELIGAGTLLGFRVMPSFYEPAIIFILPSGAFLSLGCLIALVNKLLTVRKEHAAAKALTAAKQLDVEIPAFVDEGEHSDEKAEQEITFQPESDPQSDDADKKEEK